MMRERRLWASVAIVFAVLVAAWTIWVGRPDFPLDDAYITLANARVVLEGRDPSYGVPALEGATSSLHLALVAALGLILDLRWASAVVAWLAAAAYVAGLAALAWRFALRRIEAALLIAAGSFVGFVPYHLLNGLETGLALAAVTWGIVLAAGPPSTALALLAGVMPFIRPELALLAALLLADQAWRRWQARDTRAIAGDLVLAAAAAAPFVLWLWLDTGSVVPRTAGAKRDFFAEAALPWTLKLGSVGIALAHAALQAGPLALGVVGLRSARAGRLALLFAAAMVALYAAELPGGLSHNSNRYLYTLAPLLLAGWAMALATASPGERRWLRLGLAAALVYVMVRLPGDLGAYAADVGFARRELAGLAAWIEAELPAGARIAVHDAGYLAFATRRPLIDVVGLKTPASRAAHAELTGPSAGARRGEALARILAATHAEYFVVLAGWDRDFALTDGLRSTGWRLTALRPDGAYQVYRLTPPDAAAAR
jgi:hypothetical protein